MSEDVEKFVRFCESDFGKKVLGKEVEFVYQELKDCRHTLDVGCGIGSFEQRLPSLNIIGLDNSEEMLEEARKRSEKTFVFGDAENLEFDDGLFDAVFYVATLEFLADYQKAIQEAYRVTKPNGKILVMALNPESEYFKEHMQREGSYFRKIRHINLEEIQSYVSKFYRIEKKRIFFGHNRAEGF